MIGDFLGGVYSSSPLKNISRIGYIHTWEPVGGAKEKCRYLESVVNEVGESQTFKPSGKRMHVSEVPTV